MLLILSLIFCQFQPRVAYKSVACKKVCISSLRNTKKANQKSSKKVSRNAKRRLSKRGNNQNARSDIKQGDETENQISKNLRRMVMEKAGNKRFELEHLGSIDLQKGEEKIIFYYPLYDMNFKFIAVEL